MLPILRRDAAEPFISADGSEIRELAHPRASDARRQSLAEATIAPGAETLEHLHRESEEIYSFLSGEGRIRLAGEEAAVTAGDTVVIPPGTPHKLWNVGERALVLLCCCSPPYSDADTVITEPARSR